MNLSYWGKTSYKIEAKARKMGMVYPDEIRVFGPSLEEEAND